MKSAREARESELEKAPDAEKFQADDAEKKVGELKNELVRVKEQIQEQDKAKVIEKFKTSEAFDQAVADAGAPEVLKCWLVAERHIKTNPAANWDSFVEEFLIAKDNLEKGLGEPVPFNGLIPAFLPALEDKAP